MYLISAEGYKNAGVHFLRVEIFEKYDHLSKDELNKKTNKNVQVKSDVRSTDTKCCRGENKKEAKEKQMDLEKNDDFRIRNSRVFRTRSQIKNMKHICKQKYN